MSDTYENQVLLKSSALSTWTFEATLRKINGEWGLYVNKKKIAEFSLSQNLKFVISTNFIITIVNFQNKAIAIIDINGEIGWTSENKLYVNTQQYKYLTNS